MPHRVSRLKLDLRLPPVEPRKGPKGNARRKIKAKKSATTPQEPVVLEPDEDEEDERLPGYEQGLLCVIVN